MNCSFVNLLSVLHNTFVIVLRFGKNEVHFSILGIMKPSVKDTFYCITGRLSLESNLFLCYNNFG